MKYSQKLVIASVMLLTVIAKTDVPLPGVQMSEKVKETFSFLSKDYQNGNLARLMQQRKNARMRSETLNINTKTMQMNVPLLLGAYSNTSAQHSRDRFQDQIFDNNPNGTMIDYYREVSYGQFELAGDTFGWYKLPETQAFYHKLNTDGARFTLDLVTRADADVDFSRFDSDGDGYVDVVMIVHTGAGAETGANDNIWSHSWSLQSARNAYPDEMPQGEYVTNDPRPGYAGQFIKVNDYIIQPELDSPSNDKIVDIGVFCHEFGHALGLPDLYDTDGSSEGIGQWGLMGSGSYGGDGRHPEKPAHMCPWSKEYLGWIEPEVLNFAELQKEILNSAEHGDQIFKIWMNGQSGPEYFLIENRQKVGFDQYIYGGGLLIWHIDENVIRARQGSNSVNDNEARKGVDLEEADGRKDLDQNRNRGDAGDPFPGLSNNRLFNSSSNPNSIMNSGVDSGVAIQIENVIDQVVYVNFLIKPELFVTPQQRSVAYTAGSVPFAVSNLGGGQMNWSATTTESWLSITNPAGINQGLFFVSFAENTTTESRSGFVTVSVAGVEDKNIIPIKQSATGEWLLDLKVSDKGGEETLLQLGQVASATNVLDDQLGEAALPTTPSPGVFDARLILPDPLQTASLIDFRAPEQAYIEWRATFQAGSGGMPIILSWDPARLPNGNFYIKDEFTGTLISMDMKKNSELLIPTPNLKSLKIIYSSVAPLFVETMPGWNLISIPYPADEKTAQELFRTAVSSAFLFDDNGYHPIDLLENGKAYWLKFNMPGDYSMFGTATRPVITVKRGWNMIGPFEKSIPVADILSEPSNIIISDFLTFNGNYIQVDELLPGKGYWVFVSQDGQLFLNGDTLLNSEAADVDIFLNSILISDQERSLVDKASSQNALIDIPIVIQDAEGHSKTLWCGLDPAASAQIDAFLAEEEVPPMPPLKAFDARFVADHLSGINIGLGSYRDYRLGDETFSGTVDYELRFQSANNSKITILWDLPENITGQLVDLYTGKLIKKEMVGQGQLGVSLVNVVDRLKMTLNYEALSSLAVLFPNGGEVLRIGSYALLTWNATNVLGDVEITISRDAGENFAPIATAPNMGSFQWKVTGPASSESLMKITAQDGSLVDKSDATFSIDFVDGVMPENVPTDFNLAQNYPNPFNPSTTIYFELPKAVPVKLMIINSLGQVIRTLSDEIFPAGIHSLNWDGRDQNGQLVSSGLYFYRIQAGNFSETRKMIFMQ